MAQAYHCKGLQDATITEYIVAPVLRLDGPRAQSRSCESAGAESMEQVGVLEDLIAEIKTLKDTRSALCAQENNDPTSAINKQVLALEETPRANFPGYLFLSFHAKKRDRVLQRAPKQNDVQCQSIKVSIEIEHATHQRAYRAALASPTAWSRSHAEPSSPGETFPCVDQHDPR